MIGVRILGALFALTVVLGCGGAGANTVADPIPDAVARDAIRLNGVVWPLPPGDWTVRTYIRDDAVATGRRAHRLWLTQLDGGQIKAILYLVSGDRNKTASMRTPAEQAYIHRFNGFFGREHGDSDSPRYDSWLFGAGDVPSFLAQPEHQQFAAMVANAGLSLPANLLSSVHTIARGDTVAHAQILINPRYLQKPPLKGAPIADEEWALDRMLASNPHQGARIGVLVRLRAWGLRWHATLLKAMDGNFQPAPGGRALALPILDHPDGNVPAPTSSGLRVGETYRDSVLVGPFRVPLPAGTWKVEVRRPKPRSDGSVGADSVILVNQDTPAFDGAITIDMADRGDGTLNSPCNGQTIVRHAEDDEFCAAINSVNFGKTHDLAYSMRRELVGNGYAVPNNVAGGYFAYSDSAYTIKVFVHFTPAHLGLPDIDAGRPMETPWAPFVPKWMQWVRDWSMAVEAGLTGQLDEGPLPDRWRKLDLRAGLGGQSVEASPLRRRRAIEPQLVSQRKPEVGQSYTDTVPLAGREWPLPAGRWEVLALTPRMDEVEVFSHVMVLARIDGRRLTAVLKLETNVPSEVRPAPLVPHPICDGKGPHNHAVTNQPGGELNCWAVASINWSEVTEGDQWLDPGSLVRLKALDGKPPNIAIVLAYIMVTPERALSAKLLFDPGQILNRPEDADIATSSDGLIASVLNQGLDAVETWAGRWHKVLERAFAEGLPAGSPPSPWDHPWPGTVNPMPRGLEVSLPKPVVDDEFSGTFPLGERNWPLPPGTWRTIAIVPWRETADNVVDQVVLAKIEKGRLVAALILDINTPGPLWKYAPNKFTMCGGPASQWYHILKNNPGDGLDCWMIVVDLWTWGGKTGAFVTAGAAKARLAAMGLSEPRYFFAFAASMMDRSRRMTYTLFLDPSLITGVGSADDDWAPGKPFRARQSVALARLRDWATSWHEIVGRGFAGTLGSGPLPDPWASASPWPSNPCGCEKKRD